MQGVQVWSLVGELRPHMPCGQKNQNIKQEEYCNKLNKDFKNGSHQKKKKNLKKRKTQSQEELNWLTRRLKVLSSSSKYPCRVLHLMACQIFLVPSHPRHGARLMVQLCSARVCVCYNCPDICYSQWSCQIGWPVSFSCFPTGCQDQAQKCGELDRLAQDHITS